MEAFNLSRLAINNLCDAKAKGATRLVHLTAILIDGVREHTAVGIPGTPRHLSPRGAGEHVGEDVANLQ